MGMLCSLPEAVSAAWERLGEGGRICELGQRDGHQSIDFAKVCDELVLVEAREANVRETLHMLAGGPRVAPYMRLYIADLETFDLSVVGPCKCVSASGVIYHMSKPWELIRKIAGITDHCIGWSHTAEYDGGERGGYHGKFVFEDIASPLAGTLGDCWWLTTDDFERAFRDAGFTEFRWIEHPTPHENGGLAGWFEAHK